MFLTTSRRPRNNLLDETSADTSPPYILVEGTESGTQRSEIRRFCETVSLCLPRQGRRACLACARLSRDHTCLGWDGGYLLTLVTPASTYE